VLGVRSAQRALEHLGPLVVEQSDRILWTDPSAFHGLRWGFTQLRAPV